MPYIAGVVVVVDILLLKQHDTKTLQIIATICNILISYLDFGSRV